jgi:ATP-dependent DNA helicase RecQ
MADQVRALSARYPQVCYINSSLLLADRQKNLSGVRSGANNILYIGPEQLRNTSIIRLLKNRPPFLWVIDEAHCISQWGHSFRTDYTYLPRAIAQIHAPSPQPLLALFTATATTEVMADIRDQMRNGLAADLQLMDFGAKRDNIQYEVVHASDGEEKFRELMALLSKEVAGSRLIYCATVRGAQDLAERLKECGVPCALYHGRLSSQEKKEQLEQFLGGRARTVVATSAFCAVASLVRFTMCWSTNIKTWTPISTVCCARW